MVRVSLRAVAVAVVLAAFPAPAAGAGRVHLRGTAYEFNNVHVLLAGATVRVVEYPKLRAVVRPDGTYDLVVPDRAKVTPYIVAAGHHTIFLQTFTTAGADLVNVNFQTPSDGVYSALVALLKLPVDAAGDPQQCAIVSTFSTRSVRDLSYADFIAYGAHGVAGATATATPSLARPTYFNAQVLPDPAQMLSSEDGGVLWTGVPRGVYTMRAHKQGTRFARFVATCRPGRIVNANPPWGLHELGLRNPTTVLARWSANGPRFTLRVLGIDKAPPGAVVRATCSGRGCPFRSTTDLTKARRHAMRAGQTLQIGVFAHRYDGSVWRWRLRAGRAPRAVNLCQPLGDTKPQPRCSSYL